MSFHGSNIKKRYFYYNLIFNFIDHSNDLGPVSRSSGNISDPESCFEFPVFASKIKALTNNFENDAIKLSRVNEAELTGL